MFASPGAHRLGGERRPDAIRAWFVETLRLFPDLRVHQRTILVQGGPGRTQVGDARFDVTATFPDGQPYRNEGMQLLELRWGASTRTACSRTLSS